MLAIRVHTAGGPDALRVDDVPVPIPAAGNAVVKLAAAGVNFIDTYQRSGLYAIPLPATLGQEGAGVVTAVADDVSDVRVGDRVAYQGVLGAYAEYAAVPADQLVPVPDGVTLEQAAALMLQGMTAHYLATSTYPLADGDVCLVHAAAGGVGLLLCQIAAMRGARVIGTTSTAQKAQLAKEAGAWEVINYTTHDFVAESRRLTSGRGVRVVYDSVGRTTFQQSLDALEPRGMLVTFGQSSGAIPPFDPLVLSRKGSLFLTRPTLGHYVASRDELLRRASDLFGWVRDGRLTVRIDRTLPLAQAAEAHRALESRATMGKVLLTP
jgi:NADPH2:quinone reductase